MLVTVRHLLQEHLNELARPGARDASGSILSSSLFKIKRQLLCDIVTVPDTEVPQHCTSLPSGHAATQLKKFRIESPAVLLPGDWTALEPPFRHLRRRRTHSWMKKKVLALGATPRSRGSCNIERTAYALTSLCCDRIGFARVGPSSAARLAAAFMSGRVGHDTRPLAGSQHQV